MKCEKGVKISVQLQTCRALSALDISTRLSNCLSLLLPSSQRLSRGVGDSVGIETALPSLRWHTSYLSR
jgi:hypothetical protein